MSDMRITAMFCGVLLSAFASQAQEVRLETPRGAWAPSAVTREDRRGLTRLAKEVEHAWEDRHLDDASALMDFPMLMVTDDGKGQTLAEPWTRERWLRVMGDLVNQLPADAKLSTTRRTFTFVTDVLATIHEEKQLVSGKKKTRWRTTYVCALKGDRWRITSMIEGGFAGSEKLPPG